MTALLLVLVPLTAIWAVLTGIIMVLDSRQRRRHRELLEVRAWREKVEAMRRLNDLEGDA
jgi:hypothetical protein